MSNPNIKLAVLLEVRDTDAGEQERVRVFAGPRADELMLRDVVSAGQLDELHRQLAALRDVVYNAPTL